jgi:lactate permease
MPGLLPGASFGSRTATNWHGHEGRILRYVFLPSVLLATLMSALVYLAAYVPPFTWLVTK